MSALVWRCSTCRHEEPVENEDIDEGGKYEAGDCEPCIYCEDGIAKVVEVGRVEGFEAAIEVLNGGES